MAVPERGNIGEEADTDSLTLHVRGGEAALGVVREVSEVLGCPAVDCGTGELIDFDSAEAGRGFALWRAFRDHAVKVLNKDGS